MATPYSLVTLDVTDSTQEDAHRLYDGRPVLVVAASQRHGRGRRQHGWLNASAALATSLCFEIDWPSARLPMVPLLAGLAASRATGARLKWPNDLVVEDVKVGGVLVESTSSLVTAGLGVNLWWPDPPDGMGALHDHDPGPDERVAVANRWAVGLLELVEIGPERWPRLEYVDRCATIGRAITWEPEGHGTAVDVDSDGGLIVELGHGGRTVLHSSEVFHVRPSAGGDAATERPSDEA